MLTVTRMDQQALRVSSQLWSQGVALTTEECEGSTCECEGKDVLSSAHKAT